MISEHSFAKIIFIIGGFLCYLIADGCTFSIGILYNEFLNAFHQSKASTAVLPGLIYGVPQLLGSFLCPLIDIIGSGNGAIVGGCLLSFSFFVSKYVVSIQLMYITIGVFASIGLEMTYISGIMAVTKHFAEGRYLGLALGITVSGSGIGVFIFNPLLNYLITEYTWPGAMLIESAIFLNITVAGCLLRSASRIYRQPKINKPKVHIEVIPDQIVVPSIARQISQSHSAEALDMVGTEPPPLAISTRRSSVMLCRTQIQNCEPFYKPISVQSKASSLERRIEPFSVNLPFDERSASFVNRLSQYGSENNKASHRVSQETMSSQPSLTIDTTEEALRTDSAYIQSGYEMLLIPSNDDQTLSVCRRFLRDLKKSLLALLSREVWTNSNLLAYYFVTLIFAMSVVDVWTFSYDHSIDIGITDMKASLLVSLVGAGSCFGQIFFGFISDYIHAISLYGFGCVVAGLSTIALVYITAYWVLAVVHFVFGFCQGVNYALFSVILVHYASLELYPASLAIYLIFSGSGNLIGTSFAGYLNDLTGDYWATYISGGSMLVACGLLVFPLMCGWQRHSHTS